MISYVTKRFHSGEGRSVKQSPPVPPARGHTKEPDGVFMFVFHALGLIPFRKAQLLLFYSQFKHVFVFPGQLKPTWSIKGRRGLGFDRTTRYYKSVQWTHARSAFIPGGVSTCRYHATAAPFAPRAFQRQSVKTEGTSRVGFCSDPAWTVQRDVRKSRARRSFKNASPA